MDEKLTQERHQDYVYSAPTLQPGQLNTDFFQLDPDAPFLLRGLAARLPYDAFGTQSGLQFVSLRYSGPNQDYRQDTPVPLSVMMPYYGQVGNPLKVFPEIRYPSSGFISIDLLNTSVVPLTGVQIFFRGVKLFAPGVVSHYTYPQAFARAPLPYLYSLAHPDPAILNLGVTEERLNQIWTCDNDADFVLRGGQAGRSLAPPTSEVFFTFRDELGKPYSNAPVHADVLFGRSVFWASFPCGPVPNFLNPAGPGASNPGLFFPEIYVPRLHTLRYDVVRDDSAYLGAAAVDYPVSLIGMKVWSK